MITLRQTSYNANIAANTWATAMNASFSGRLRDVAFGSEETIDDTNVLAYSVDLEVTIDGASAMTFTDPAFGGDYDGTLDSFVTDGSGERHRRRWVVLNCAVGSSVKLRIRQAQNVGLNPTYLLARYTENS